MSQYFSLQETQRSTDRESQLFSQLVDLIEYAKKNSEYYANTLAAIVPDSIVNRAQLGRLPITRKSDLIALQQRNQPFAGLVPHSAKVARIYQSPGPINEPENTADDWWRLGQAFYAAGFRPADKVQNCLSYHLTPGGFILDSGARACGCIVIPAGPGQSEQQLNVIEHLKPQGYCGTPSFLKILLDKARRNNRDVSSIHKALVTGEAYMPALRAEFKAAGILALQAYVTADLGLIGFESDPHQGLIVAENIIVEIVRPGTSQTVPDGQVGEVVVTSFNRDYPLIRFATGDLSAVLEGTSTCGRTNMRIKGWMGRADQTTKIKGMFVHPEQVEKVRLAHPQIQKVKLIVSQKNHNDTMTLQCEVDVAEQATEILLGEVRESLKDITKLSGEIEFINTGSLADDGKVIDDQRSIE